MSPYYVEQKKTIIIIIIIIIHTLTPQLHFHALYSNSRATEPLRTTLRTIHTRHTGSISSSRIISIIIAGTVIDIHHLQAHHSIAKVERVTSQTANMDLEMEMEEVDFDQDDGFSGLPTLLLCYPLSFSLSLV